MKAVALTEFGGPGVLRLISLPASQAAPGQIRLRVTAAAVNLADAFLRDGGAAAGPLRAGMGRRRRGEPDRRGHRD
jgi:NADPH:quinone reductase